MVSIVNLPPEIILKILKNETISLRDVENFSSTCKKFQWISHDKNFWKKKCAQRWPTAQLLCKDKMGIEFNDLNIKDFKDGMKCTDDLWVYVSRMSQMYYYRNLHGNDSIVKSLEQHVKRHPLNLLILYDELTKNIYQQDPRQCNLTERYYSIKLRPFLYRVIFYTKQVVEKPKHMQRLEDLIVLILQYCHPNKGITMLYIDKFIDNIVQEVLRLLKDKYLQHPILSIPSEQLSIWRNNRINKNYWCEKDAMSIKDVLDKIIISFDSYKSWMEPNQIKVNTISLTKEDTLYYKQTLWLAIYICVANRLGLHVVTTKHDIDDNYTLNTHLVWQSRNCTENTECFTFEWTDNPDNAKISNIRKCQRVSPQDRDRDARMFMSSRSFETISVIFDLWRRGRCSYELHQYLYESLYLLDYNEKICTLDEACWKQRPPYLKYAIGLIVTHKHKMEDNTQKDVAGVIIGWHNKCHTLRFKSEKTYCISSDVEEECTQKYSIDYWKSYIYKQPHYVLLIENDLCYVAQCAITSVCKEWINNLQTGKYFCKFEGTHYVPNKMLQKHYPDDAAVVRDILSNQKL